MKVHPVNMNLQGYEERRGRRGKKEEKGKGKPFRQVLEEARPIGGPVSGGGGPPRGGQRPDA